MGTHIDHIAELFRQRWRAAPPVNIVRTAAELPVAVPDDAEAIYRDGEVTLIAETLHPARAVVVMAHEGIGHHGLRQILGRAWPGFMGAVLDGSRRDPLLRAARGHVETIYAGSELTERQVADELCAAVVERRMDIVTFGLAVDAPVRKQLAAVRGHMAREVLLLDAPACGAQVEGALLLAERRVRHGRAFFGWLAGALDWYARAMAPKFDPTRRPMSHEESKALLRGAEERERFWTNLRGFFDIMMIPLGIVLFIVGIVAGAHALFDTVRLLIR